MTGSVASASSRAETILIVAPNWLGDGIMAMPALQYLRSSLPSDTSLELLARRGQAGLWNMHTDIDQVHVTPDNRQGTRTLRASLRSRSYTKAILLPNSFRSALLPFRAGIPIRRGTIDHFGRRFLVNDPVPLEDLKDSHQQWEMARLMLGDTLPHTLPPPQLIPPDDAVAYISARFHDRPAPVLGLIPGAARGPSKQWPADRFSAVARKWVSETSGTVCWLGTPGDVGLCRTCNASLEDHGIVLAGKTTLPQFAAALSLLDAVVANDSGGMHLATALNVPVIAVFGITDPGKTGPLSSKATVIQHSMVRSRRVPRESPEAVAALESIAPEEVFEAVLAFHSSRDKGN